MAEHTPTPWCVQSEDIWSGEPDSPGVPLYRTDRGHHRRWGRILSDEERDANAALIVEAVNSHASNLAAIEQLTKALAMTRKALSDALLDFEEASDGRREIDGAWAAQATGRFGHVVSVTAAAMAPARQVAP